MMYALSVSPFTQPDQGEPLFCLTILDVRDEGRWGVVVPPLTLQWR